MAASAFAQELGQVRRRIAAALAGGREKEKIVRFVVRIVSDPVGGRVHDVVNLEELVGAPREYLVELNSCTRWISAVQEDNLKARLGRRQNRFRSGDIPAIELN